jgi:hypothetical protein
MSTSSDDVDAEHVDEVLTNLERNRAERDAEPSVVQFDQDVAADMGALEGTIIAFWGEESLVEDIEQACKTDEEDLAQTLEDRVGTATQSKQSTERSTDGVNDAAVVFDIEYDGQALGQNLRLADGDEIGATMFSHDGGELDESKFAVREHLDDAEDSSVDYCILAIPPVQGDIEATAMDLFGDEEDAANVRDGVNEAPYPVVAVALYTAVDTLGASGALDNYVDIDHSEVSDEASVDELVETHESLLQ